MNFYQFLQFCKLTDGRQGITKTNKELKNDDE